MFKELVEAGVECNLIFYDTEADISLTERLMALMIGGFKNYYGEGCNEEYTFIIYNGDLLTFIIKKSDISEDVTPKLKNPKLYGFNVMSISSTEFEEINNTYKELGGIFPTNKSNILILINKDNKVLLGAY